MPVPLLPDDSLTGSAWCRQRSDLIDGWMAELFQRAAGPATDGLALVAVGGYGRSELCPKSDVDVLLLHRRRPDASKVAERIWYPVWDEGLHLGHKLCSVREALCLAGDDLDTATALLSARLIVGQPNLAEELAAGAAAQWQRRPKRWLAELGARVAARHAKAGEVAFLLEPDLKEGRGGLRDEHSLRWAEAARRILLEHDEASLAAAYAVLLDARVELQRRTGRESNVLLLQEQDGVAAALGCPDADHLMACVAEAARTVAWTSDDTWRRIRSTLRGPLGRVSSGPRDLEGGIHLRDGEVHVDEGASTQDDPHLVLQAAAAAAAHRTFIERHSLERMAASRAALPDPWPGRDRQLFVDLLLSGPPAIPVIEALDQRGLWTRLLPEWEPVRARPQRNAYHRYTVDRHLLEATANVADLAGRVDRPDILAMAALLHDIGKGYDGDHSEVGVGLAAQVMTRMGFPADDIETTGALIRDHLLLPDVATRRDLDDPTTIERVAASVGSTSRLRLLAALTEADSSATGPWAWGPWKADLVGRLVDRVVHVLEGGESARAVAASFPTSEQLARLDDGAEHIDTAGNVLTVVTRDRPGVFSRVAGVLALHGLDVVAAAARSTEEGRALAEFRVHDPMRAELPWPRVVTDLRLALDGRLALNARLAERARVYARVPSTSAAAPGASVSFDDDASANTTVIDVRAADGVGVLYRITRAMAELDLDIRSSRAQTLGGHVVDSFYVRDTHGRKITDAHTRGEIERAVLHGLQQ